MQHYGCFPKKTFGEKLFGITLEKFVLYVNKKKKTEKKETETEKSKNTDKRKEKQTNKGKKKNNKTNKQKALCNH